MCCKCKACCALGMNFRLNFEILTILKMHTHTYTHSHIFTLHTQMCTLYTHQHFKLYKSYSYAFSIFIVPKLKYTAFTILVAWLSPS